MCYPQVIAGMEVLSSLNQQQINRGMARNKASTIVKNLQIGYNQAQMRADELKEQASKDAFEKTRQLLRTEARIATMQTAAGISGVTADLELDTAALNTKFETDTIASEYSKSVAQTREDTNVLYLNAQTELNALERATNVNPLVSMGSLFISGAKGYLTGKEIKEGLNG